MSEEYAIEFKGITKRFGSLLANNDVSWRIKKGEVHALLGENGAGKSTITSILFGLIQADAGEILIYGKPVNIQNPNDANALGIGMVHQHFKLVPSYTVVENIVLGMEPRNRFGHLDYAGARSKIKELSTQFGLDVDPDAKIRDINVGMQQRVEILKTLYRQAQIIVLDEPTAVLTPQEIDELMQIILRLKSQGRTIIFISHKLKEIKTCADQVTVLRRGQMVGSALVSDCSEAELARMMVGHEVSFTTPKKKAQVGGAVLRIEDLSVRSPLGALAVEGLTLNVHAGEIVGIAGVDGNGQSELTLALAGVLRPESGKIFIGKECINQKSVRQRVEMGFGLTPENRETQGGVGDFNLAENYVLKSYYKEPYSNRFGWLNKKRMIDDAQVQLENFDVRSADGWRSMLGDLSGGNRQKLIVAREIALADKLLVVSQPTRGLDVGSIEYIHRRIIEHRDQGKAILLISFELDEILNLCDRIAAISHGKIVGVLDAKDATKQAVGQMMATTR
ncbi:ABC transporter ATP-binding protein [Entomospira culicis]|uniref:ABC transporter ATP-binding protein n=1 Tax=Entomospira culicis TaxID=2719989 RepID=A0A968GER4_9SPIO|nr:ABC transporter ATP-binding protein [Entomospira culicis]NIZ19036.1 ABC transporter ATP-binding protein [Entomospira culicis]NIZ69251.1 ABC transporter ATP-binding protein [Entomospira culicis]WDI37834.1 ABC transporter ATP-binding protein [Entomospira culicis]WDI39462.1 ABC transporter ATP-binding protein [Entomospira culicis]